MDHGDDDLGRGGHDRMVGVGIYRHREPAAEPAWRHKMTRRRQLRFWLITLLVVVSALYILRDMLLPFVAGMAIAYFLDPIADRLERYGAPRWLAATCVLLFFVLILVLAILLLVPLIQSQIVQLVDSLPLIVNWVATVGIPTVERMLMELSVENVERL